MPALDIKPPRTQTRTAQAHFHHWDTPHGDVVAWFFRTDLGFLIRFPDRADFTICRHTGTVSCVPAPEASRETVTFLYHNQIVPLVRSYQGELVVHASAIAAPDGALAFLGSSGRGKSTLAAAFARAGHPFMTDDGLWIERSEAAFVAMPNRPGVRLWADSERAVLNGSSAGPPDEGQKGYIVSGPELPFWNEPLPIRSIYILGEGKSAYPAFKRLTPLAAVSELIRYCYILDVENGPSLRDCFDRLIPLVEAVPCFVLDYPRRYEELPIVIQAIVAHAAKGVTTS